MNSAVAENFMPRLTLFISMLLVYINGQKAGKDLAPEASPTPTSTLKCSLVRVGSSLLASGSGEGSGSGYGWLYPDNFTLQASAGLEDPLDQEYSLVCDSLQASTHSEEISNAFPSSIVSTTLATFTIESAPVSSYLPPTVKSVFNSVIPIPTPDPDNIVEIRLALSASQHESLQDSGSPERAALEIALANEYLQTLNTSSGRAKRQTQPSVTAKITEIGPRNSSTGETPILFYIIDGSDPVPASIVVSQLASLSHQEIDGYPVVSIATSPGVTASAIVGADTASPGVIASAIVGAHTAFPGVTVVNPTADTASQSGMSMGTMGGVVAITIVVCIVVVLLIALIAFALNRKFSEEDRKRREATPSPTAMLELDLIRQLRSRRRHLSEDYFTPPSYDFFNPTEHWQVEPYNVQAAQTNNQQYRQLQHRRCVRRLHEWQARRESELQASQPDESDSQGSNEIYVEIEESDKREEKQASEIQARQADELHSHTSEDEVRDGNETQARQLDEGQRSQTNNECEGEFNRKPRLTVTFHPSHTEIPSSEVVITPPSFSGVSNLSQISKSDLDLDIMQPRAK